MNIKQMLATWREARKIAGRQRAEQADADERRLIARAFNDRYTYRFEYIPGLPHVPGAGAFGLPISGGFAWMCSSCNKIHHPYEMSVFTGLMYPTCCKTPKGHRLYEKIQYDDKGNRS